MKIFFLFWKMHYWTVVIFSLSVLAAAITSLARIKNIDRAFYPFIICLWAASFNEIISIAATQSGIDTALNNNVYVLLEALLITWQFKKWGFFGRFKHIAGILMALLICGWLAEYHSIQRLRHIHLYFRIAYPFLIVLMSLQLNNMLIFSYTKKIIKNPAFLICTGFIIYFTFKILVEAFWIYGLNESSDFRNSLYIIVTWINFLINILYAIAILCIPMKKSYLELY